MDGLKCLKYLDLSSNNLTALPCSLFQLPLEVLNVSNNKLDTLSGDIVQTGETLQELDLSRNKLTSITTSISLLKQLRVLNLMCNKLDALPSEIVSLELYTLNVTGNRLTDLPVELCSMSSLIHLYVNDNPLQSPPIEIAMKGREHIFKYLQSAVSSDVNYRGNYTDWSTNRNSFINATIRRPKNAERLAAKAKRFAALNSSDSGYTSTGDDQRHSFELQLSRNSLESIDEGGKIKSPICRNKREIPKSGSLGTISNEDEGVALTPHLPKDLKRDLSLLDEVLKTYEEMAEQSKDIKNNNFKLKEVEMNVNEEKDIKNNNMVESNEMEASMYTKLACVYITESTIIEGSSIIVTDKPPKSPAKEIVIEKAPIESAEVTLSSKENEKSLLDCGNCVLVDSSNISTKTTPGIVAPASRLMRPSAGMSKLAPPSPSKSTLLVKKDSVSPKLIKPTPIITSRLPKVSSTRTSSSVSSRSSTPNSSANTSNSSNSHENSSDSSIEVMSKILSPKGNSNGKGDISSTLASGVLLCNFVNKLKPRSITVMSSISPSQPLPLPKAKKNAENFVNSAKKLGVSEVC
uniref:Calponin-homology (CH) domain-containing protein n=1 Tax=Rhabditophanes sp. KR3021 TaxID=114890 RepID=A0AC35U8Z9_9BILA